MTSIRAGRRDVEISRPDKELFPGITKLDLAELLRATSPTRCFRWSPIGR